jgi:anti-sigma-K factor RskA
MIPDDLQDQAALYVLGVLDAQERIAFEAEMRGNVELRAVVREMREAAVDLSRTVPFQQPPAELKQRVLREIALEKQASTARRSSTTSFNWLPWTIAALLLIFCGLLAVDRTRLERELADTRAADPLARATLVSLTSPTGDLPDAKATVAWEPDLQSGVITIKNMAPAGKGRDYQLWAVDANHKDPINAGIIHVDASGVTRVRFKPDQSTTQVKAFAISLEREGGVPKREGPIVMIGNA